MHPESATRVQWIDHGAIADGEERLWEVISPWEANQHKNVIDIAEDVGVPRALWSGGHRGFTLLQKSRVRGQVHYIVCAPAEWMPETDQEAQAREQGSRKMKLFSLRPIDPESGPWDRHDVALGFVVRAESESAARLLAQQNAGDEVGYLNLKPVWTNQGLVSCIELAADGPEDVIIRDFRS